MADEADIANDRAQRELDAALAAITHPADGLPSAIWCEECDEQIPEARRSAVPGCLLCIQCQSLYERSAQQYRVSR